MKRRYMSCHDCHARMLRVDRDHDDERRFLLCKSCGNRVTHVVRANGIAPDWPREVFDRAVERGIVTPTGRVVPRRA